MGPWRSRERCHSPGHRFPEEAPFLRRKSWLHTAGQASALPVLRMQLEANMCCSDPHACSPGGGSEHGLPRLCYALGFCKIGLFAWVGAARGQCHGEPACPSWVMVTPGHLRSCHPYPITTCRAKCASPPRRVQTAVRGSQSLTLVAKPGSRGAAQGGGASSPGNSNPSSWTKLPC